MIKARRIPPPEPPPDLVELTMNIEEARVLRAYVGGLGCVERTPAFEVISRIFGELNRIEPCNNVTYSDLFTGRPEVIEDTIDPDPEILPGAW